jgi:hypothetical protein
MASIKIIKGSISLKDFKQGIPTAHFPPEQSKEKSKKYTLRMEEPYKKYFDALVRLFLLLISEVFRCEKA